MRTDLELVQSKKASDMSMIRELRAENKTLGQDLQEVQQKATELEIRLDKALEELKAKKDDQVGLQSTLLYPAMPSWDQGWLEI